MTCYSHALVLIHDREDGAVLVKLAAILAEQLAMKITLAHVSDDYREMNYVSDSIMDDVVSADVIKVKEFLSSLTAAMPVPADTRVLVTMSNIDDVEECIVDLNIDLIIAGHRNRFLGLLTSKSMDYINHLNVDVLIRHIY
ncbi:universal stress protein [Pantoea sp. At-9b]|jgi:nucleotide-binding universal stress UspA family protein|uniref:universal stress protein n=1 Tax=Pantoea sp. (strain At-9b) TaxID=592316 RepID=UPI0001B400F3|nr:universal stress protein [Pantoea sp. At-9b]ADU72168.1 universal stress protein A [Pantoea sp. At-9b]